MRGSMRPMKSDSASVIASEELEKAQVASKPEEEEAKDTEKSLRSTLNTQTSLEDRPRTVSFNEDAVVTSYDKTEAPIASMTQEKELLKESPVNEDMSIDEMIRKVEEKDDLVEDSGNNYEVSSIFGSFNLVVVGCTPTIASFDHTALSPLPLPL